jgi:hypothetical protein
VGEQGTGVGERLEQGAGRTAVEAGVGRLRCSEMSAVWRLTAKRP